MPESSPYTLYWHSLLSDGNGRDRRNYTTDVAGNDPAETGGSFVIIRPDDLLRFDGEGSGANDACTFGASTTTSCGSIYLVGYTGTLTINTSATLTVAEDIVGLGHSGNVSGVTGTVECQSLLELGATSSVGSSGSRATLNLVDPAETETVIAWRTGLGNVSMNYWMDITSNGTLVLNNPSADSDSQHLRMRGILTASVIEKLGSGRLTLQSGPSFFATDRLDILAGRISILQTSNGGSARGLSTDGSSGTAQNSLIRLAGNNTTLALGLSEGTLANWHTPVTVLPSLTGVSLLLNNINDTAVETYFRFPLVLGSNLELRPGLFAMTSVENHIVFRGDGTGLAADAGTISGAGALTVRAPTAAASDFRVALRASTGAGATYTGGTSIIGEGARRAAFGYTEANVPNSNYSLGTAAVAMTGRATLLFRGSTTSGAEVRLTNALNISSSATSLAEGPVIDVTRSANSPTSVLQGAIAINSPFIDVIALEGGSDERRIDGTITLAQNLYFRWQGASGQNLLTELITGPHEITILPSIASGHFNLTASFPSGTTITRVIADGGPGWMVGAGSAQIHTDMLLRAGSRLRHAGSISMFGDLVAEVGSVLDFVFSNRYLNLNKVGGDHVFLCNYNVSGSSGTSIQRRNVGVIVNGNNTQIRLRDAVYDTTRFSIVAANGRLYANSGATISPGRITVSNGGTLTLDRVSIATPPGGIIDITGGSGPRTITATQGTEFILFRHNGGSIDIPSANDISFDIDFELRIEANLTRSLIDYTFLRDLTLSNRNANVTVDLDNITVEGDFYTRTNIDGLAGNLTTRINAMTVVGDFYHRQDQVVAGVAHRLELVSYANLSVLGDFRPQSNKVGAAVGLAEPQTLSTYAADNWILAVAGDVRLRPTSAVPRSFTPLNGTGYADIGRMVFDLTEQDIDYSAIPGAVVADASLFSTALTRRELTVTEGAWHFNSTTFVNNDMTFNVGDQALGFNVSSGGTGNELILGAYVDAGYSWNQVYNDFPAGGGMDFRGFDLVDTSANNLLGIYPRSATEYWFDGAEFTTVDLYGYAMSAQTTFRDNFSATLMSPRHAAGALVVIEGTVTVRDLLTATHSVSSGMTVDVTGLLVVTGVLDLRLTASANSSYDVRLLGNVQYRPAGASLVRVLDFGGPAAGLPNLSIINDDVVRTGDAPQFGVALAIYPFHVGPDLVVRNESDDQPLQFIVGSDVGWESILLQRQGDASLMVDFNGYVLSAQSFVSEGEISVVSPSGSTLRMFSVDGPATIDAPQMELPIVQSHATQGLTVESDLSVVAFQQNSPSNSGTLFMEGNEITATGQIAIVEGSVDTDSLAGATFTADLFTVAGVDMVSSSPWFVNSTQEPTASLMLLGNSDASGGTEGNAKAAVDGGDNVNWDFGTTGVVFAVSAAGLGLGLGLGIVNVR